MGKLFGAFSQIAANGQAREGSGLGLYLCRKITDLLGAEVGVRSEFGKGSVFTLTLPFKPRSNRVSRPHSGALT